MKPDKTACICLVIFSSTIQHLIEKYRPPTVRPVRKHACDFRPQLLPRTCPKQPEEARTARFSDGQIVM